MLAKAFPSVKENGRSVLLGISTHQVLLQQAMETAKCMQITCNINKGERTVELKLGWN